MAGLMGSCSDDGGRNGAPSGQAITVDQLVARSSDTAVAVRGLLLVSNGTARLCAAVLESYPPQCGEPSVELVGLDLASIDGLTTANAVTWKEGMVVTVQRRQDTRFDVVTEPASGG
jgi:hypothetical protein